jgi:acetyl esterase/lipase
MLLEKINVWPDREDVFLQAYIQEDSSQISKGRRRPAVLVLPGGAYLFTSDREAEPVALRFAGLGYHAFVLRYSVFFGQGARSDNWSAASGPAPGNPHAAYPGPLFDLAKAMLIIREQADRWLLDPEQIALCGFSAGGHLAASLGVHWTDGFLKDHIQADNRFFRPAAMILGYPLTDCLNLSKEAERIKGKDITLIEYWHVFNLAVFHQPEPPDQVLADASPVLFVNQDTPPAFLWHTATDGLVPVAQSLDMAAAMSKMGIPCELHVFENGPHGLSLADAATAETPDQINEPAQAWFALARNWLNRHLPVLPAE